MTTNAMIQFDNVSKIYSKQNQVRNIHFSVGQGECFALCGGNGAGKSTIIQMMIGIVKPTSGSIYLNGRMVSSKDNAYKSTFAYMPDNMVFPRSLTGYEVLHFFSKLLQVPRNRINELLHLVGLERDKHKKVSHYSKGMQQRLALAQALLPEAPIIILDEPTNGLDPYWVHTFKELLHAERRKGTTILYSTHILSVVEDTADTVAFMNEGVMVACDSVARLCRTENGHRSLEAVFYDTCQRIATSS